jgi:hypothetical protein
VPAVAQSARGMEPGSLLPRAGLSASGQGEAVFAAAGTVDVRSGQVREQTLYGPAYAAGQARAQPWKPRTPDGEQGGQPAPQRARPPDLGIPPPALPAAQEVNPPAVHGSKWSSKWSNTSKLSAKDERAPLAPQMKQPPRQTLLTFVSIFLPPGVFTIVYYSFSFVFRDRFDAYVPYIVQWTCYALAVFIYLYALTVRVNLNRIYLYFIAAGVLFMSLCGGVYGDENYGRMRYFYAFQSMAAYVNINPSLDSGQSYSDAGEVYFKEGSRVDTTRAVAFKNSDVFCAAPIILELETGEEVEAKSMDWWAVGVNCCKPSGAGFTCGQSNNYLARSGMRLLEPYDLAYYQFAVHQFSKKYDLPAKNPLFFNWVVDPLAENGMLYLTAHRKYYQYVTEFFILNLVAVIIFRTALDWSSKHA